MAWIPIRGVVSDFGGVLTTPLIGSFAAYQERSGVAPGELGEAMERIASGREGRHPLHELERGRISEAEFLHALEAELGGDVRLREFAEIYFQALERNDATIEQMRSLRQRGLRMALLTNNVREWEARWRGMLPEIDEIFEVVVDSAFVGLRKPEPEIYWLTLERLDGGLRPQECVFVDDTDVNCEAARELGMHAVHFVDAEQAGAAIEALVAET